MTNRILVALDGSGLAEQVIPYASVLAERTGASLVLATAITAGDRWVDDGAIRKWEEEEQGAAEAYLASVARGLAQSGVQARGRVQWGRPDAVLQAIADDEHANLIALTTHGRSGFARWRMGSVADKLLRSATTPLLLVHAQKDAPVERPALRRILLPLDGSPLAESALPFVEGLAKNLGASVLLQHAVTPVMAFYGTEFIPGSLPVMEGLEAGARDYLAKKAKGLRHHGLKVETRVDFVEYAGQAIIEAAQDADLIALTTHGRTGPARWIIGSVADAVIRHAEVPCLVIPCRVTGPEKDDEEPVKSAALLAGTTVVPPPGWSETPIAESPRVTAPATRGHRPERSPGR